MDALTVIPPGGGEVIGDSPDRRVEILCDDDAMHVTWSRFGPGRDGADLHIHRLHTDLFYVLAGTLLLRLGVEGEEAPVPAGTLARVPPLVVHGFRNGSADAEVRYLNLHAPGAGFAAYMRGLRDKRPVDFDQEDPPAVGTRPTSDAVVGGAVEIEAISVSEGSGQPRPDGPAGLRALYVLEGELAVGERSAPAGSWIEIPPGLPHDVTAAGPARWLDVRAPVR
jgi:quercetin dioxygenase-like cupin family protein